VWHTVERFNTCALRIFREVPRGPIDITGDSQAAVDKADDAHAFDLFAKLIDQDRAMFGFRHWQTLHLLVSQSEARPFDGLGA
jgi:hypothetical protein